MSEDCIPTNALIKLKQKKNHKKNNSEHAAKKRKIYEVKLIQEKTSKLIKLHFLNNADPKAQVNFKNVKKVSEKKSIFEALFLKLRIVLEILQEFDLLAQKNGHKLFDMQN